MNETLKARLIGWASRLRVPAVAVLAFALGALLFSGGGDRDSAPTATPDAAESKAQTWTCSMHPQIRQPEPGQCPICGMDLIPVTESSSGDGASSEKVQLSEEAKRRARIRTTTVRRLGGGHVERRLLGRVDYDESTLRTVTAWTSGRIDRLLVRVTGARVAAGQTIAKLYSPEIHNAAQDLVAARQQLARLASATQYAREAASATLAAARDRLRLLGIPADEIEAMEKADQPVESVAIRTPFGGTVIERMATEGSYVSTGTGLYKIADLSRLWVQLDAYESDLPLLKVGQEVELKVEALPGDTFTGRVTFVDPVLNSRTRTTRVRIEVRNKDGQLRPGMFAEATVAGSSAAPVEDPLVVPDTAPLFTGRRSVVYVEALGAERPTYEAREVKLGTKLGEYYPVLAGLREGERVVTHGAFAIDADLQIRGGDSMMSHAARSEPQQVVTVPKAQREPLAKVLRAYLQVHAHLAADALDEAKTAATDTKAAANAVKPARGSAFHDAWMAVGRQLSSHAATIAQSPNLDGARLAFRDLSQSVATVLRLFGNPTQEALRLAFCPMALNGEGAEWVQTAEKIENPYFGASMHSCGEVNEVVEHGTYLPSKTTGVDSGPAVAEPEPSTPPAVDHSKHDHAEQDRAGDH